MDPPDMGSRTVDQLAKEMITTITVGIAGTDVKAGIIGEVGTSHPITENERKVLRAAAQAHKSTGVSINIHISMFGNHAMQVVRLLESEGVDLANVIISHMDEVQDPSLEIRKAVAGAYVEFDCFGEEDYNLEWGFIHPRDTERASTLKWLVDAGYIDNLLISHDVCMKMYMRSYGGYDYDHIQREIVPMLRRFGMNEAEIERLMVENPGRAIAH